MNGINHIEYPENCKSKSSDSLRYIISDCQATLEANPDGEKSGYYADEINYCAMELKARADELYALRKEWTAELRDLIKDDAPAAAIEATKTMLADIRRDISTEAS